MSAQTKIPPIYELYNSGVREARGNTEAIMRKIIQLMNTPEVLSGEQAVDVTIEAVFIDVEPVVE